MDPTSSDGANQTIQTRGPEDSTLVISALGRPLHLGTLYNALNDTLIPGIGLWTPEALKGNTRVLPQESSRFQVSVSESLRDKTSLLDLSSSLKLSYLCGLVEVGGSAHYLREKTSSACQCRVSLKYQESMEVRELMFSQMGAPDLDVLALTDATHVVTQVLYGAVALMEFEETASDASGKQDTQAKLNVMIKKIPSIDMSADGSLNMNDEDKEKVQNFSCKFYGDFRLTEIPSTYEEAVKVYKQLPSLLGVNIEKAMPVMVWLYPLSKLGATESKLKKMISETLVSAVEKVMDDLHHAEIRTNDLLEKSKEIKAEDITTKLELFQSSLRDFGTEFLQKMADVIPVIREDQAQETALNEVLKSQDASGFGGNEMEQWLDGKETEINIVSMYINKLKCEIKSPGLELESFLMNPDVTDAFVFSFTSLRYEEPYLDKISQTAKTKAKTLKTGSTISTPEQNQTEDVPWYRRPEAKKALDSSVQFITKALLENKVVSFIPDPKCPAASVLWYRNAVLVDAHMTNTCALTLDPNTANRKLVLSEGNRKVTCVEERQPYPPHPCRFDNSCPQVLSREPLIGHCYWECEWIGRNVDVGVACKGVSRGKWMGRTDQAWCLECFSDQYKATHNGDKTLLSVPPAGSGRVGVCVDREAGTVSFYRVSSDTLTHLHTFNITHSDEPLHAVFYVRRDSSVFLV